MQGLAGGLVKLVGARMGSVEELFLLLKEVGKFGTVEGRHVIKV